MYFRNNVSKIRKKIGRIHLGLSGSDKLRIMGIEFLNGLSRSFRTGNFLEELTTKLCAGLMVQVDGVKYSLIDLQSLNIICNCDFEPFMSTWLKPRKNEVFMDIGAHIGKYALSVAKIVGDSGKVIAVEPHPTNYRSLQRNISVNNFKNVGCLNVACWSKNADLNFFVGDGSAHHSLKANRRLGVMTIKALPADGICEKFGINRMDWIKIDAEHAEYEILQGLKKTMHLYKPKIIVEVRTSNMDKIKKLMRKHNYGLIKISPQTHAYMHDMVHLLCVPLVRKN